MTEHLRISLEALHNHFQKQVPLTIFCYDYYAKIYRKFLPDLKRSGKIRLLFQHCQEEEALNELSLRLQEFSTGFPPNRNQPLADGGNEPIINMSQAKELYPNFAEQLLSILLAAPSMQDQISRNLLLLNLPPGPVSTIPRHPAMMQDLMIIINMVESWGQLPDTGKWGLIIVAENALPFLQGTQAGEDLKQLMAQPFDGV